jgi:hypothetical protein
LGNLGGSALCHISRSDVSKNNLSSCSGSRFRSSLHERSLTGVAFSAFIAEFGGDIAPGDWNGTWFDDVGGVGNLLWMGPGALAPDFEVDGIGTYEDARR